MSNSRLITSILHNTETDSNFDIPFYICSRNSIIESIDLIISNNIADSNVLYTELQLIDKGFNGLGSDIIGYITSNPDLVNYYRIFNKFIKISFFKESVLEKFNVINNKVFSLKKIDTGGAILLGNILIITNERRY